MRSIEKAQEDLAAAEADLVKMKTAAEQADQHARNMSRNYQIAAMKVTVAKEVLEALQEEDEGDGSDG